MNNILILLKLKLEDDKIKEMIIYYYKNIYTKKKFEFFNNLLNNKKFC